MKSNLNKGKKIKANFKHFFSFLCFWKKKFKFNLCNKYFSRFIEPLHCCVFNLLSFFLCSFVYSFNCDFVFLFVCRWWRKLSHHLRFSTFFSSQLNISLILKVFHRFHFIRCFDCWVTFTSFCCNSVCDFFTHIP